MSNDLEININITVYNEYVNRANRMQPGNPKDFILAIRKLSGNHYAVLSDYSEYDTISVYNSTNRAYRDLCGHPADGCNTLEEFFHPNLQSSLRDYFGDEEAKRIEEECALASKSPCFLSVSHPFFHSNHIGDYANIFFKTMARAILFAVYGLAVEELFTFYREFPKGFDNHIALELHRGNEAVFSLVEKHLSGKNCHGMTIQRFSSIAIKSGVPRALELIVKSASSQEQFEDTLLAVTAICNMGTIGSHIYFIKLILENELCRFSSMTNAFDSWTGFNYKDNEPDSAHKRMSMALKFLSDESAAIASLVMGDITEISIALWALSCRDINKAANYACLLLDNPDKFRRLVGWYFITLTGSESFRHSVAVTRLNSRDLEELAWVSANLHINADFLQSGVYRDDEDEKSSLTKTYYDKEYPDDPLKRIALFEQLADVAVFMSQRDEKDEKGRKSEKGEKSKKSEKSKKGKKGKKGNENIKGAPIIRSIHSKKNVMFTEYTGIAFPWLVYGRANLYTPLRLMLGLAAYDRSDDLTIRLKDYIPIMDEHHRQLYYCSLLNPEIQKQRILLMAGLSDSSSHVRINIIERLKNYQLDSADMELLVKVLNTRKAHLRKAVVELIGKQSDSLVRPVVDSLLHSLKETQLIAGKELVALLSKENHSLHMEFRDKISAPEYSRENGYGLYNPDEKDFDIAFWAARRPDVKQLSDSELKAMIVPDEKAVISLYERISDIFISYKDYKYKTKDWFGTYKDVTLGGDPNMIHIMAGKGNNFKALNLPARYRYDMVYPIDCYPLENIWIAAAGDFAENGVAMAALESIWIDGVRSARYAEWFYNLFSAYPIERWQLADKVEKAVNLKGVSFYKISEILSAIRRSQSTPLFNFALSAYINLINKIPAERLGADCEEQIKPLGMPYFYIHDSSRKTLFNKYITYWRQLAYSRIGTDAQFTDYFSEMWYEYLAAGQQEFYGLEMEDLCRAHHLGLISDAAIYMYFTTGFGAGERMSNMTSSYGNERAVLEKYPAVKNIMTMVIDRILTIEENSGEMPTELSKLASSISSFNGGIRHFVKLLTALGDTGFHNKYKYSFAIWTEATKKERFSELFSICKPTRDDTPEKLHRALKEADTPIELALRAAVYTPAWAELLEKALEIDGLKCGVWFLHAHLCRWFSNELETEATIYTNVDHKQYEYSAFDTGWFFEAYKVLGPKRFDELYINAKTIAESGEQYKQLRLYMDAALGKLKKTDAIEEITKSRNLGMLRAYAIIPLDNNNPDDVLERYEFILQFRNEIRKSSSARKTREREACQIAFENLGLIANYGGAERMIWALEGQNLGFLHHLTQPRSISGTEVWLNITKNGTPEMIVSKNGESPAVLSKEQSQNEIVTEIRSAMIRLREQKKRAPGCFEAAMAARSEFTAAEIVGLLKHPTLHGLVSNLVFISDDIIGFPILGRGEGYGYEEDYGKDNGILELVGANGKHQQVMRNLIIAHPIDFINHKCLDEYRHCVYQNRTVQPFNQVFREHYPITRDELEAVSISQRFSGCKVSQNNMEHLLRKRGWKHDCNTWMQKIWRKEKLVSRVSASAAWLSGVTNTEFAYSGAYNDAYDGLDVLTLDTVRFFSYDKYELIPFLDVPPVVFSETMRDIEITSLESCFYEESFTASHSIVETRIAIAREILSMLSIKNVTFQGEYANITGLMDTYMVHMGTGAVYQHRMKELNVTSVNERTIRRMFLPYEDFDQQTLEILLRITLFANDGSIKDINLIEQIEDDRLLPPFDCLG